MPAGLSLHALEGFPLIAPGDDLARIIGDRLAAGGGPGLCAGDILVIAQKIVSKAEGRIVELADVTPGPGAGRLAAAVDKDPRLVELILRESIRTVRHRPGVLIVEHRLGLVLANAGIDASNVNEDGGEARVLLLPRDPDGSCAAIRAALRARFGVAPGVIVADSIGRAWRVGTVGTAIGAAGLPALLDLRGERDLFGRVLKVSEQAVGDELAAAASLLQGQGDEGRPVVLVRGYRPAGPDRPAAALLRARDQDLFR